MYPTMHIRTDAQIPKYPFLCPWDRVQGNAQEAGYLCLTLNGDIGLKIDRAEQRLVWSNVSYQEVFGLCFFPS